ncbi:rho-related GTP-binding protein RhoN isoform X1 [Numida meleagris]|uniref:rho-related GTP-binding protein RhoN isoform X1 n=1 Tax=Numida meleagris TaxID=8996 RepID=UPI000B3E0E44|nr:rho-related GTP-binding protein RhoN isoform X1 [Numida meleagris]
MMLLTWGSSSFPSSCHLQQLPSCVLTPGWGFVGWVVTSRAGCTLQHCVLSASAVCDVLKQQVAMIRFAVAMSELKGAKTSLYKRSIPGLGGGSAYYDNVRPLAYPDSDAVLICFDISRPETLDSVLKKWQGETQEFCPNAKIVLVGCKLDMRTDLNTLRELSKQRLIPVTHEQGSALARQIGAVAYAECSSKVSEDSVRDVFHVTTLASVNRIHKNLKRSNSKRGLKRASQMPSRTDLLNDTEIRKDRAKSCSIM